MPPDDFISQEHPNTPLPPYNDISPKGWVHDSLASEEVGWKDAGRHSTRKTEHVERNNYREELSIEGKYCSKPACFVFYYYWSEFYFYFIAVVQLKSLLVRPLCLQENYRFGYLIHNYIGAAWTNVTKYIYIYDRTVLRACMFIFKPILLL